MTGRRKLRAAWVLTMLGAFAFVSEGRSAMRVRTWLSQLRVDTLWPLQGCGCSPERAAMR